MRCPTFVWRSPRCPCLPGLTRAPTWANPGTAWIDSLRHVARYEKDLGSSPVVLTLVSFEAHMDRFSKHMPQASSHTLQVALTSELFAGLDRESVNVILVAAQTKRFAAKRTIVTQGERVTHLFLLIKGRVSYYKGTRTGHELVLRLLVPGDVFGLGALLRNPPLSLGSAKAISNVELAVWGHASIRKLTDRYPQLHENAFRMLIDYLKAYAERHAGLLTKTAEQRLADKLLGLGYRSGREHPKGVEVEVTNEQLGSLADVSLFTASRLLSGWERKGAVLKERGKVVIRSPEALVVD